MNPLKMAFESATRREIINGLPHFTFVMYKCEIDCTEKQFRVTLPNGVIYFVNSLDEIYSLVKDYWPKNNCFEMACGIHNMLINEVNTNHLSYWKIRAMDYR